MIIQEQGDQLVLIRQTDHAVLAGHFARELGNDTFALPQPQESFVLAATEHDNGWNEWELLPEIDSVTYLPYSFMSVPTREHIELYQGGNARVVKVDRYAGLLVSVHCLGLYDRTRATIPGFSAKYVKSHESQTVKDFLQSLRLRSEEHTSELQSRQYLVCRLLLEKKKNKHLLVCSIEIEKQVTVNLVTPINVL